MTIPIPRDRLEQFARKLAEYKRRETRKRLEGSLIDFFEAAWPHFDPAPFTPGWHLEAIAEHLEAVARGEIRRIVINVPPRHSKTLLVSVAFPAWCWAQPPDPETPLMGPQVKFMCLSYGDSLAMDSSTLAKRLVNSEWYQSYWGNRVKITKDQDNKEKFDTTAGGTRISSSFGAGILGRGADIKIIDDPHKVDEVESELTRERVIRTYDGTLKSRITDPKLSAEITIMQRLHEVDLAGHILQDKDVVHLCLPAEYEKDRHCSTSLGWEDPRTIEGELLWKQRFGETELAPFKINPYEWAGQWQQRPEPRGGGIIKRDWWQLWEKDEFPEFEYIVASADTAFTEKEENDPTGCTVWGLFREGVHSYPKLMLIWAWRKHLELHGKLVEKLPNESELAYQRRSQPSWGLVEWLRHTCKRFKVDMLLIENRASGKDAGSALSRMFGPSTFGISLREPKGDKVSRMHAVVPTFSQNLVYAPAREWADLVIDEVSSFPKGRYKDLSDSTSQALKYLRDMGLIEHAHEVEAADYESRLHRGQQKALYDA